MELTLTPRLAACAALVPAGARLADVGTDHGYLPVRLLLDGTIPSAVASDLRAGPLERAKETARRFGVEDRISFRLCDGLSAVGEDEADAVCIAGMGGETIANILSAAPWTKKGKLLLLQPMTGFPELRLWLSENGYRIRAEHIAREGKRLYTVMEAAEGEMGPLTPAELWAGRQSDDPLRGAWLDLVRSKAEKALAGQRASKCPDGAVTAWLEQVISGLNAMRKEL